MLKLRTLEEGLRKVPPPLEGEHEGLDLAGLLYGAGVGPRLALGLGRALEKKRVSLEEVKSAVNFAFYRQFNNYQYTCIAFAVMLGLLTAGMQMLAQEQGGIVVIFTGGMLAGVVGAVQFGGLKVDFKNKGRQEDFAKVEGIPLPRVEDPSEEIY